MDEEKKEAETPERNDADPSATEEQQESTQPPVNGSILEAAFLDPAYPWPLSNVEEEVTAVLSEEYRLKPGRRKLRKKRKSRSKGLFSFGSKAYKDDETNKADKTHEEKVATVTLKHLHHNTQEELEEKNFNNVIPEGLLVYRLDTSERTIQLISSPPPKTDFGKLVRHMKVVSVHPSGDKSRRCIHVEGEDRTKTTLVACDQRTALVWLDAMGVMLGRRYKSNDDLITSTLSYTGLYKSDEGAGFNEREYLTLASFSHNMIKNGEGDGDGGKRIVGDIYYDIRLKTDGVDMEDRGSDVIKRRSVFKDSWAFYRLVCALLRDRVKYNEIFRRIQLDPVYPYFNSLTGLNDPGNDGYENLDKPVGQEELPEYECVTQETLAQDLVTKGEERKKNLLKIATSLGSKVGALQVAAGPPKTVQAAIRKANKKYDGDMLKITDYCRALIVVPDLSTLLALLELCREECPDQIRRIKLSSLKSNHKALPGGYRDCKINLEIDGHICELQIHFKPMWDILGVNGFKHYQKSLETNIDSFQNPFNALKGMDMQKTAELILVSEESVVDTPLENLKWDQEDEILHYFAQVGLLTHHQCYAWAEATLKRLIDVRIDNPDIGVEHDTTLLLFKYLDKILILQNKNVEAEAVRRTINHIETKLGLKEDIHMLDAIMLGDVSGAVSKLDIYALDNWLFDPNKKEREAQEHNKRQVKAAKRIWRKVREERFPFLSIEEEPEPPSPPPPASEKREGTLDNASLATKKSNRKVWFARTPKEIKEENNNKSEKKKKSKKRVVKVAVTEDENVEVKIATRGDWKNKLQQAGRANGKQKPTPNPAVEESRNPES